MQSVAAFALNTNLVEKVKTVLLDQISIDAFPEECSDPAFGDWYADVMAESGCSTNEILMALAYVGTNCCACADGHTNTTESGIMTAAICHLGRYDVAHRNVEAICYAVTNNASATSIFPAVMSFVNTLGMGHNAFQMYDKLVEEMPNVRTSELISAIRRKVLAGTYPTAVTNRAVAVSLKASDLEKIDPGHIDWTLCALWGGYANSSNRLERLNYGLSKDLPQYLTMHLSKLKSELLSLPPGTLQMLPTNQFYNVED